VNVRPSYHLSVQAKEMENGEKTGDTIPGKSAAKQGQVSNHWKGRKASFIGPYGILRKLEPPYPPMPRERQEHSRRPTVLSSFLAFEP